MDELPIDALFSASDYEHWCEQTFTVQRSNPMDPALTMRLGSRALLFDGHIYVEMVAAGLRKDVRVDTLMVSNNVLLPLNLSPDIPDLTNRDEWEAAAVAACTRANAASVVGQFFYSAQPMQQTPAEPCCTCVDL